MPKPSAAILLWRACAAAPGGHNIEIYLVQRAERVLFMPGFWAFCGGRVDPQDCVELAPTSWRAAGPGDASFAAELAALLRAPADLQQAQLASEAAAQRCARRELFEELGVWSYAAAAPAGAARAARRRQLLGGAPLPEAAVEAAMGAAGGAAGTPPGAAAGDAPLLPLGSFTTPHFTGQRFAARYYALQLPPGEAPEVWPGELQAGRWMTPEAALAHHDAALLLLAPPVMATLQALAASQGPPQARLRQAGEVLAAQAGPRFASTMVPRLDVAPVRSPTLPPSTHTNCYVLGEGDLAVVDPGTPYAEEQAALVGYLRQRVAQGARVRQVWLTHHHPDHTGAATLLQRTFGAQVLAHAQTAARLAGDVHVDALVADDEILPVGTDAYRALYTPGHAAGHLCFYDTRRGHLLSGDNVLGVGTSLVVPQPEGDAKAYLVSLRRLLALRLGLLFPGHGPPAAVSERRIADTLKQRLAREQMLLDLVGSVDGPWSVRNLIAKLYRGVAADARGLAALSCLAHVEKLVAEGALQQLGGAGLATLVRRPPPPG